MDRCTANVLYREMCQKKNIKKHKVRLRGNFGFLKRNEVCKCIVFSLLKSLRDDRQKKDGIVSMQENLNAHKKFF